MSPILTDRRALREPIELFPIFRERIWGRESLDPFFGVPAGHHRIGEVWFTFEENETSARRKLGLLLRAHPELLGRAFDEKHPGIPLLVKLLFTTERLSVQVHPDDAYAAERHNSLGKTEAWYVVDTQPPGEVAVGLRDEMGPEEFRRAAETGAIEDMLAWRKVSKGDVIFVPAGTVHAIGAGLTICEIQQNSDITYRLYDYGRPRELHLDHGQRVSLLKPYAFEPKRVEIEPWRVELLASRYFRMEKLRVHGVLSIPPQPQYSILICVEGSGSAGGSSLRAGQALLIPANAHTVTLDGKNLEVILTYTADKPAPGLNLQSSS